MIIFLKNLIKIKMQMIIVFVIDKFDDYGKINKIKYISVIILYLILKYINFCEWDW